ncbi:hypothetical protein NBRC10512_004906 [Rhodotorula toruloides]|uniref:RHTO0S01e12464g1_1 n=2 Tax=Rhodotorula toruloides TaxID=5286 RepID=A0A061AET4_RHOTO|nr:uncharacterized protein RHTO_04705 [Rhodotorula toruloides NP11]EMS24526.1 hypothetical protein RHTO_04705 [Rhodotorula toruloides NP11]KAJ8297066.1 hypothetical protein OF846_000315 [Rhodotorula toruloides]CDR36022.1 RHTO0S01e12464g1_1 [Rhodotorula toruloides]
MARSSSKSRQSRQSSAAVANHNDSSNSSDVEDSADERAFELPRRSRTRKHDRAEAANLYSPGSSWMRTTKKDPSRKIILTGGAPSYPHQDERAQQPNVVEAQPHHSDHGWYHSDPQLDGRHKMSWVPAVFVILVVIIIIVVVAVVQK